MAADEIRPEPSQGQRAPGLFDRAVIGATIRLPANWLGMRLAILLRRLVTMRMDKDAGMDVERWGLSLRLHPRDNGCEKMLLFTPQLYEAPERAALAAQIDSVRLQGRPFVFVDIGANVGLFSLFVAAAAKRDTIIIAVEPERENLRRLRFNVAANSGLPIRVLPFALGEAPGVVGVTANLHDRGGTRTAPAGDGGATVECKTLIEALAEVGVRTIDALKIDVEGNEDTILMPFFAAAPQQLWPKFILIEDSRADWRSDLFGALTSHGYREVARTRQNVMLQR